MITGNLRSRGIQGPDDYGSMKEVLTRRFTHGLEERRKLSGTVRGFRSVYQISGSDPDGWWKRSGECSTGSVGSELHLNIPVCGMVKDDHHRTRGLYYENREIPD